MNSYTGQNWVFAENFVPQDEFILAAQHQGEQFGVQPVSPGIGGLLRVLAATISARNIVEIGTGTGTSGLWLLQGMGNAGVLTTIDIESEYQIAAKQIFTRAGYKNTRTIAGRAIEVLPRLSDSAYDLVLLDADTGGLLEYTQHALRLLQVGGILAIPRILHEGKVTDPARRDPQTTTLRQVIKFIQESDQLMETVVPMSDGLLLATRVS